MAKGYGAKADVLTRTRDGQDLNTVWDTYEAALESFNTTRQPLIDLLSSPVDTIVDEAGAPGTERFELQSEFGLAQSIRPAPTMVSRAYPFDWYDLRQAYTWRFLIKATQRQLDAVMSMAMEADNALVFEQVTKSLFNNANRTTTIDGTLTSTGSSVFTVVALYNADGSYIPPWKGQSFAGSHTHYLASGANAGQTAFDPQDFLDLAATIEHHGFVRSSGYNIIFLMNPTDAQNSVVRFRRGTVFPSGGATTVESLYDFIPTQADNATIMLPPGYTLVGGLAPNSFAGLEVAGSWGPYLIVQDYQIPAGYMVAAATAGQSSNLNIIGIREDENPALRGLVLKPGNRESYPLIDSSFVRGIGAGVRQRGASAIMKLDAAGGAYTVPASMVW